MPTKRKTARGREPKPVVASGPKDPRAKLKAIGESQSDCWNRGLAKQVAQSARTGTSDKGARNLQSTAKLDAMASIGPNDEFEGMMAAQKIAAHNAAMNCYGRAMVHDQPFEAWRESLN